MSDAGGPGAPAVRDQVLAGRYRLVRLLAQGGMAAVWEGRDEILARPVAIKVPHARLAADPTFRERFRREAVAAARLAHPGIVATYDTGADGPTDFIVMELVPGRTVGDLLAAGAVPAEVAVPLAAQVAEALDVAHRAGLVHRDIKPANLLLVEDGPAPRVKVADFGVAWARAAPPSGNDLARAAPSDGNALVAARQRGEDLARAAPSDGNALVAARQRGEDLARAAPSDGNALVAARQRGEDLATMGGEVGGAPVGGGLGDGPVTREGLVVGTARYLAPEQVAARPVDGRTDVYAVGCVLHEMLAGRPPFVRDTDLTTALAHLTDAAPSLGSLGVRVDPVLERLVLACLAKEPEGRPASALLLAQQLRALAAPPAGPPTAPVPAIDLSTGSAPAPAPTITFAAAVARPASSGSGGVPAPTAALPVGGVARAPSTGPGLPPTSVLPASAVPLAPPGLGSSGRTEWEGNGSGSLTQRERRGPSGPTEQERPAPSRRTGRGGPDPEGGRGQEPRRPSGRKERRRRGSSGTSGRRNLGATPVVHGTRTVGRPPRSRVPLVVVATLVLAALGMALVVVTQPEPRRSTPPVRPPTSAAVGRPVIDVVRSFDPEADGRENDSQLPRLVDGNPATTWSSEDYNLRPVFGNLKKGVGVVLDLDRPAQLDRLRVRSPSQAWAAQVYVAGQPATTLAGWGQPVARASAVQGDLDLDLDGKTGGAVLVWFTDPGRTGQVVVGELELGAP